MVCIARHAERADAAYALYKLGQPSLPKQWGSGINGQVKQVFLKELFFFATCYTSKMSESNYSLFVGLLVEEVMIMSLLKLVSTLA